MLGFRAREARRGSGTGHGPDWPSNRGIRTHSEAFSVSVIPEARRRSAPEWQPDGNHADATGNGKHDSGSSVKPARRKRLRAHVEKDRVPSILVRRLDRRTLQRPKERARVSEHSPQQEIKEILERAAGMLTMREARRLSERWRHRLSRRSFSDSARLIREDRDSR
jgi:hypothetical protein